MHLNTQKISSHLKPKCLVCRKTILERANLQFPCFIRCMPSTRLCQSTRLWLAHTSPRPAGFRRPHVLLQWCELRNEGSGGMWQIRSEEGGRAKETGEQVNEGRGKKQHVEVKITTKHLLKDILNPNGLWEAFAKVMAEYTICNIPVMSVSLWENRFENWRNGSFCQICVPITDKWAKHLDNNGSRNISSCHSLHWGKLASLWLESTLVRIVQ